MPVKSGGGIEITAGRIGVRACRESTPDIRVHIVYLVQHLNGSRVR